jgi:hypothetical protein
MKREPLVEDIQDYALNIVDTVREPTPVKVSPNHGIYKAKRDLAVKYLKGENA